MKSLFSIIAAMAAFAAMGSLLPDRAEAAPIVAIPKGLRFASTSMAGPVRAYTNAAIACATDRALSSAGSARNIANGSG